LKALFINSGLLGMGNLHRFITTLKDHDPTVHLTQINLAEPLSLGEKLRRRFWTMRFWPDGFGGVRNADIYRWRAEWHAGLLAARRIRKLEEKEGVFDVLHFHGQATAYASLARMRRQPTIISIDATQDCVMEDATTEWEKLTYQPNVFWDGKVFQTAALIISTSRWAADSVRRRYPSCSASIEIMPYPVIMEYFPEKWMSERQERAQVEKYRPVGLFMGGDFFRKGGDVLLAAWKQANLGAKANLKLVTQTRKLPDPLPAGVEVFHDIKAYSAPWLDLWRQADFFVMPTQQEAFGMVYQEAGAAGLPVIGSKIAAVPEIVLDQETGYLIERRNEVDLVEAMNKLIDSTELRLTLGRKARRHIQTTADSGDYARRLFQHLHSLKKSAK
jgi:glycosyltransferase involved in cell wall biosynthesis